MKNIHSNLAIVVSFLIFFVGSFAYMFGLPGLSSDDFMRVYLAARWAQSPVLVQFGNWPPGFSVFYGFGMKSGMDPLTAAHLLTAAICGVTAYMLYRVILHVGESKNAALFGITLFLLTPLHAMLSVSTLSEPLFVCVALLTGASLFSWVRTDRSVFLWATVVSCILLTTVRTEGTPSAGLLALFILYRKRNVFGVLASLSCIAFPMIWLKIIEQRIGPLSELLAAYRLDSQTFYQHVHHWNAIPYIAFAVHYPVVLLAIGWSFIFRKSIARETRILGAIFGLVLVSQWILLWDRVSTVYPERLAYYPGVLGIVFATMVYRDTALKRKFLFSGVLVLIVSLFFSLPRLTPTYSASLVSLGRTFSTLPAFTDGLRKAYAAAEMDQGDFATLAVNTKLPQRFVRMQWSPEQNRLLINDAATPAFFFLRTEAATAWLQSQMPRSTHVRLGEIYFVTNDVLVMQQVCAAMTCSE